MILWLGGPKALSPGLRAVLASTLVRGGLPANNIIWNSLHNKVKLLAEHDKKKMPDEFAIAQARKVLTQECEALKPKVIVINDKDTLQAITQQKYSLEQCRGSVYYFNKVPCIVVDNFAMLKYKIHAKFQFEFDLAKIVRYATGKTKNEPSFDLTVCRTVKEVVDFCREAQSATMVATDKETASGFCTCVGFTYDTPARTLKTFVIPFFDPNEEDGCYWKIEKDEIEVRRAIAELQVSRPYKAMQNGTYDCAYDVLEGTPPQNYFVDTANMMHAIWCEAPKKLQHIASYFLDCYTYWKDENKGEKEDGFGRGPEGMRRYWRYNGLDCYYTWLGANELLSRMVQLPWALNNYNTHFSLSVGPCLASSLIGMKTDKIRHQQIMYEEQQKAEKGKADLIRLTGEEDFNVNSTNDVAWLLYDVYGARPTRLQKKGSKYGKRSTDEKILKLMKEQRNFFVSHAIDRVLKAKKPNGILSNFGNFTKLTYRNGRFLSWLNAAATETGRFNSGKSQFWTGRNGQNIQPELREMFVADNNYVLYDVDYSASDDRFIAYESQDTAKIEMVESGKDPHCYHASIFFSRPYDTIYNGWKDNDPEYVDSTKGIRQNTKRVTHGRNFRMRAATMYNTMGRDAVVATAKALGHSKADGYTDKQLIGICEILIDKYDDRRTGLYKRIQPWQDEIAEEAKLNDNLATTSFGFTRKFFGSMDDWGTQSEIASFYGQGDTAGNCNKALRKIYYSGLVDGKRCIFVNQGHDSMQFLLHKDHIHYYASRINTIMEEPFVIHGRTSKIPVQGELGLTWGKKMLPYGPNIAYADIVAFEEKTFYQPSVDKKGKKQPPKYARNMAELIVRLGNMNFDSEHLAQLSTELHGEDEEALEQQEGDDLDDAEMELEENG